MGVFQRSLFGSSLLLSTSSVMRRTSASFFKKQQRKRKRSRLLLFLIVETIACEILFAVLLGSGNQDHRALEKKDIENLWQLRVQWSNPAKKHSVSVISDSTANPINNIHVPTFIIAGAQKSGTTALQAILKHHPNLQSSQRPEAHFFDRHGTVRDYRDEIMSWHDHGYGTYLRRKDTVVGKIRQAYWEAHFSQVTENTNNSSSSTLTFEKTPSYLLDAKLSRIIHTVVPWTKIVVLLRNPVDRLLSQYQMRLERQEQQQQRITNNNNLNNNTLATLEEIISAELLMFQRTNLLDFPKPVPFEAFQKRTIQPKSSHHWRERSMLYRGCYALQLEPWLHEYALHDNILVLNYESFEKNHAATLAKVLDFVGASPYEFSDHLLQKRYSPILNNNNQQQSSFAMGRQVSNRTRLYLKRFYQQCNQELANMLGEEWSGIWDRDDQGGDIRRKNTKWNTQ